MKIPTNDQIGAALQNFALRLAPIVAATYTAGYVTGEFVHQTSAKLPRLLRFLGVAA